MKFNCKLEIWSGGKDKQSRFGVEKKCGALVLLQTEHILVTYRYIKIKDSSCVILFS